MITTFWDKFCQEQNINTTMPEAWMFGDQTKAMGDELGNLVLEGKKTGTCSAHALYEREKEPLPQVGQYDIILNGDGEPIAITQLKKVTVIKMDDVTPEFARKEGEGDLSYDYWYQEHVRFFTQQFKEMGLVFSTDMLLVCEEFEVVYRN